MKFRLLLLVMLLAAPRVQSADSIVAEGVVAAPVPVVWAAWTTAAGLKSWLAPHADIDLRLDGLMRTNYSPTGTLGDAGTIENRILAFEPERILAIKVAKAPAGFPFGNALFSMWTVLYFTPADGDRTHLRIVGLGFTPDEDSQKLKAFFAQGNQVTLEQLQRRFAPAGAPATR